MVAYSYKRRFVEPMLWGIKDQTMRAERRGRARHAIVGDTISNYVGMRTKACELVLKSVCTLSCGVRLIFKPGVEIIVEAEKRDCTTYDTFAKRDGFRDFDDLAAFWRETHEAIERFEGRLIRWQRPSLRAQMGVVVAVPERKAA